MPLISIQTILVADARKESSASSASLAAALVVHFICRASVKVVQRFTAARIARSSSSLMKDCVKTQLRSSTGYVETPQFRQAVSTLDRAESLPRYSAAAGIQPRIGGDADSVLR